MSAEEADKTTTTDASGGDEEEEWLYGDEGESKDTEDEEAKLTVATSENNATLDTEETTTTTSITSTTAAASTTTITTTTSSTTTTTTTTGNGVASQEDAPGEDEDSESDSDDDDDDVRVTIGDIKTGAPQYSTYGGAPVNLNIKTGSRAYGAGTKVKGVDLEAPGSINGVPVLEVDMESFEEKPWRKPGADLSDYFNYGFNEDTWKAYCEKQKRLRMGLDILTIGSTTSKISVQQGRTGNSEKEIQSHATHSSKSDFSSPSSLYKSGVNSSRMSPPHWAGSASQDISYYTKSSGTIDVIGGQTATISRVEGRRRHNLEGNNIQVISEHPNSEPENTVNKMPPPFFPPGTLPPNIPPPPFLPPPVNQAPPMIPPPRIPITVPPPNFPPPTGGPHGLIPTLDNSGHPGGYDRGPIAPYPFPPGAFPPPMPGAVNPWPGLVENSKPWDYYPRRDKEREKERERDRQRDRGHDRDHSPSAATYNSDEERFRYRDYGDRSYDRHRERASREKEERHRERRHREKDEGRHKSSRSSSSRRRHDSEEGDSHRRHKHKKSKRSKEGKEASEERSADQENQEAME